MTQFYATRDSEDGCISQEAHIVKFATRAAAEEYLRAGYDPAEWSVDVQNGSFGDCWIKAVNAPKVGDHFIAPFSYTQLVVVRPGQHPGGRQFWIEPRCEVLVATLRPVEND